MLEISTTLHAEYPRIVQGVHTGMKYEKIKHFWIMTGRIWAIINASKVIVFILVSAPGLLAIFSAAENTKLPYMESDDWFI